MPKMTIKPFKINYKFDQDDKDIRYAYLDDVQIGSITRNTNIRPKYWGAYIVIINGVRTDAHTLTEAKKIIHDSQCKPYQVAM